MVSLAPVVTAAVPKFGAEGDIFVYGKIAAQVGKVPEVFLSVPGKSRTEHKGRTVPAHRKIVLGKCFGECFVIKKTVSIEIGIERGVEMGGESQVFQEGVPDRYFENC